MKFEIDNKRVYKYINPIIDYIGLDFASHFLCTIPKKHSIIIQNI